MLSQPALCLLVPSPRHRRAPPQRNLCTDPSTELQPRAKFAGLRKRWRRRKPDSIVAPPENEEGAKEDAQNGPLTAITTSQCPIFSKTFPRHRINTSAASKGAESEQRRARRVQRGIITNLVKSSSNDKARGDVSTPWGRIFRGMVGGPSNVFPRTAGKKTVESLYREEVQQGVFRWASSSSADVAELPFLDLDCFSAAGFWRTASEVVAQPTIGQQHFYLALPETTPSVAQNLCDILNWHADLLEDRSAGDRHRGAEEIFVRAELDSRGQKFLWYASQRQRAKETYDIIEICEKHCPRPMTLSGGQRRG